MIKNFNASFKRYLSYVWLLLAPTLGLAQDINLSLTLAYNVFVVGEPALMQIEAINATPYLIEVGAEDAKEQLLVEINRDGQYNAVESFNNKPIAGKFALQPGQVFTHVVALDKWFPLLESGKYMVRVIVVHQGTRYESSTRSFDVVPGMPVMEGVQMFVNHPDLRRKFKLVYWHRNQYDRLFLRMEEMPGEKTWDTVDLGDFMRIHPPKLDISPEGEVTVVHRANQDAFVRTLVWSLPEVVEVIERNSLLDPEISASQRVKSLYGEMADEKKDTKKSWWQIWKSGR